MDKEDVFPMVRVPFEDSATTLPKNDKLLTFQDMVIIQLPQKDRKNHHPGGANLVSGRWDNL